MILNTTYHNKEHKQLLENLVGKSFTFLESLKMKGVGSKRMIVGEVSPNLQSYMNTVADINYANIELRKSGILIFINKGLQNFTWAIPYYQLVMYKTNGASIHAQEDSFILKTIKPLRKTNGFLKKCWMKK